MSEKPNKNLKLHVNAKVNILTILAMLFVYLGIYYYNYFLGSLGIVILIMQITFVIEDI